MILVWSSDLFIIWKFYFNIIWRLFQSNVHLFTIDLQPYLSVLKLFTFTWHVDDLVVWFSGNLEGWNLSLKLPGAFLCRQSFANKIFQSMMKSFSFSIFISYICFSTGAFNGRKFIILIPFSWSFSIFLNSSFWSCPHIWQPYIKFELNNEKYRVFNKCFGVKCLIFARSPIPQLCFFFSWLKYKFQLRCSFIVRPRYLTCVVCGIY